jgi:hypothetical protein
MKQMQSIGFVLLAALAGCMPVQYGVEHTLTLRDGTHPTWAVAPAINISGQSAVDPILQADIVFEQLKVNNLTVIPVNRVVAVYAALHIEKVESEEQAAIVCQQLGCDALVVPTVTIYDPYDPPKAGIALQLLRAHPVAQAAHVDARELVREAAPRTDTPLPVNPQFIQVVGMYDSADGTVRDAVLEYAKGRNDPMGPMKSKEYFVNMDRYCGFAYHTLIVQLLDRVSNQSSEDPLPVLSKSEQRKQMNDQMVQTVKDVLVGE